MTMPSTDWSEAGLVRGWLVDLQLADGTQIPCCYLKNDRYICCLSSSDQVVFATEVTHTRLSQYTRGVVNR